MEYSYFLNYELKLDMSGRAEHTLKDEMTEKKVLFDPLHLLLRWVGRLRTIFDKKRKVFNHNNRLMTLQKMVKKNCSFFTWRDTFS